MGFVYKITDKKTRKVFIGYRTSIPFSRLRGQLMSELADENNKSLFAKHVFESKLEMFNFRYEMAFESGDIRKLKMVKKRLIDHHKASSQNKGFNQRRVDYKDWGLVIDAYEKNNKHLTNTAKELGMDFRTIKQILNESGIKTSMSGDKFKKSLTLIRIQTGKGYKFNTRSAAIDWLIEKRYALTENRKSVHTVIKRVLNGERKSAYGFWVVDEGVGVIYVLNHKSTGLRYVGGRMNAVGEIKADFLDEKKYNKNSAIYNLIKEEKYDAKKFGFEILDYFTTSDEGDELKRKYIREYATNEVQFGLNITEKTRKRYNSNK